MKGYYITTRCMDRLKETETGIYNKINAQFGELSRHFDMELLSFSKKQYYAAVLMTKVPFSPVNIAWNVKGEDLKADFIYYRFESGNPAVIRLLQKMKKHNPKCKLIVEFPTYPFDWSSYSTFRRLGKPQYDRAVQKLKQIADRSIAYGDHKDTYGIPTILTQNGIDCAAIAERKITIENTIRLLSVSKMVRWHRIDRMIEGIAKYYAEGGTRDIRFDIVGTGAEYENIQALVREKNLENRVILHGYQKGTALNACFDAADIAVDGLCEHPKQNSSLKSREYWAKGMPVVTSNTFSAEAEEIAQFIHYVPTEDAPVDLNEVIRFYDEFYGAGMEQAKKNRDEIRGFAKHHYDISAAMAPIVAFAVGSPERSYEVV